MCVIEQVAMMSNGARPHWDLWATLGPTSEFSLLQGEGVRMEVPKGHCLRAVPAVKPPRTSGLETCLCRELQRPGKAHKLKMQVEVVRADVTVLGSRVRAIPAPERASRAQ